jgi:pyruvate/2-oxoglutarate/acetoin dehydrogenase E1 component
LATRLNLSQNFRVIGLDLALEENPIRGVTETIPTNRSLGLLDAPIERIAGANTPVPFAPRLEDAVIPNEGRIAAGILRTLGRV